MCLFHAPPTAPVAHPMRPSGARSARPQPAPNATSRSFQWRANDFASTSRSMMVHRLCPRRSVAALLLVVLGAGGARAADDVSPWDGDARSAARLIAGPSDRGAPLREGIEIRLSRGWHTYWRYPGDAGVPPRFDFAGSQNVKAVEVLWPAPPRLPEAGLTALGYARAVVFPRRATAQDPAKPVTPPVNHDYASRR